MIDLHEGAALLTPLLGPQISAWWLLMAVFIVPAAKWAAALIGSVRADQRASGDSDNARMARLIELLSAELDRTTAMSTRFGADLERLREARWSLEDQMQVLRDQAIAARAMVHELQRGLGVAETPFPPLPYPLLPPPRATPPPSPAP